MVLNPKLRFAAATVQIFLLGFSSQGFSQGEATGTRAEGNTVVLVQPEMELG